MSVIIQGKEIAAKASEIKLPASAVLVEDTGRLPEVALDGEFYLAGLDGKLYKRVVNTLTGHAAFDDSVAPPAAQKTARSRVSSSSKGASSRSSESS